MHPFRGRGAFTPTLALAPPLGAREACLAATAAPEDYARQVLAAVDEFEKFRRDKHLATA